MSALPQRGVKRVVAALEESTPSSFWVAWVMWSTGGMGEREDLGSQFLGLFRTEAAALGAVKTWATDRWRDVYGKSAEDDAQFRRPATRQNLDDLFDSCDFGHPDGPHAWRVEQATIPTNDCA